MMIQDVENFNNISGILYLPNEKEPDKNHMLNPNVSEDVVQSFHTKIAVRLLQLFRPSFPRIGARAQTDDGTFEVAG